MTQVEQQLAVAITMLENFAMHDERHGNDDDADYIRQRVAIMKRALPVANTNADLDTRVAEAVAEPV